MTRIFCVALLCCRVAAFADTPADPLATCVADKTTGKDRKDLARWTFFAMGAHPEMSKYASQEMSADLDATNKTMGELVMRLLTSDCASEARQSYGTSGISAVETAFGVLGRLAMRELMSDKNVKTTMQGFQKYLDGKKLNEVLSKK